MTFAIAGFCYFLVHWLGLAINTVSTSSMVPTYMPTDMVLSVSPERFAPEIGDAIVFETDYVGQHIPGHIHRIIARNADGTWVTQGDANPTPDGWRVQASGIKGVAVFSVPGKMMRDPKIIGGLMFLVLLVGLWPRGRKGDDGEAPDGTSAAAVDAATPTAVDPTIPNEGSSPSDGSNDNELVAESPA
ncbi:MAG: S24/S26 family peptidase [Actinomycetes bacterium]